MYKNKKIERVLNLISKFEDTLVIFFLFSLLIIATTQIILRNVFDSGIIWGDSLLSILVLWLGLAASIVASRQKKHINIDVFTQYLPDIYKVYIKKFGQLFAAIVCLCIGYFSFVFISGEYMLGEYAFEKIPVWLTESIIPFAFLVMGVRYFLQSVLSDSGSTN